MIIKYKNKRIEKICEIASIAERRFGLDMAIKIRMRIDQISAASSVEEMIKYNIGRCHQLTGNRRNQYAVDLIHPMRLIFLKSGDEIQIACIMDIVDYH